MDRALQTACATDAVLNHRSVGAREGDGAHPRRRFRPRHGGKRGRRPLHRGSRLRRNAAAARGGVDLRAAGPDVLRSDPRSRAAPHARRRRFLGGERRWSVVTTLTFPELDTPTLLVDLDVMEANITEMAKVASDAGVRLRPHTKTHKCPEIAEMQIDAGATGITVAKLGEAEVMAAAGQRDLLVAYPIVGEQKLRRLRAVCEVASVRLSLDSVEVAEGIGGVGRDLGRDVPVLVEVDTGLHRLGRPPGDATVELVKDVARIDGVDVIGLLTHAGHAYRSTSAEELRLAAEREVLDLVETAEACARSGIELQEISAGSTPTARVAATVAGAAEIRPGTYVFNDVQQLRLGVATE